jgi:hypothetical protein
MKLYSAIGVEDLSNPLTVQPTADNVTRRLGCTDMFSTCGHPSYVPVPTPGKGLTLTTYASMIGFELKDIIAEYPTGDCWVALGLIIDPTTLGAGNNVFFTTTTSSYSVVANIGNQTHNTLIAIAGQGKRCCIELVYKPLTNQYRVYVNGVVRQAGTFSALNPASYPLASQMVNFNGYGTVDTTTRILVTDAYFGVVDSIDDRLGNFKINKLVAKTTTLSVDGMTPGGAAQLTTGDHAIEFDVAPLANQIVVGVAESIRAYSPGPTSTVITKRKVNGVETAARAAANVPVAIPVLVVDDLLATRVAAPLSAYAPYTPLTECKLTLSIVAN